MPTAPAEPYNPCGDGLVAKIWECLRRNEKFRALLTRLRKAVADGGDAHDEVVGLIRINSFAFIASGLLTAPSKFADIESASWPSLSPELQRQFASFMNDYVPGPFRLAPPPFDLSALSPEGSEHVELVAWLASNEMIWGDYDIVAVPKTVRDDLHRKEILAQLEAMMPPAKRRGVHLKGRGRILGTEREWDTFLFVEASEAAAVSREVAFEQAAWRFFKADDYRRFSGNRLGPEGRKLAKRVHLKQGSHVSNRYQAIKSAIESVFPAFRPFVG